MEIDQNNEDAVKVEVDEDDNFLEKKIKIHPVR